MRGVALSLGIILSVVSLCTSPLPAANPDDVEQALAKAKRFVYAQFRNGSWEKVAKQDPESRDRLVGSQWGGATAIACYALLAAGDNPNAEPKLAEGVAFLKQAKLTGTYALGIRCLVWQRLPQTPEVRQLMKQDAAALLSMMKTQGPGKGFYDYDARGSGNAYSLSRAQYAVLGVWAAAESGAEIPTDYWRKVEAAWVGHQDESGGWNYQRGNREYPVTAGMTAAGVATLYLTQEFLLADSAKACEGNPANPAIGRGLKWLAENFSEQVAADESYDREFPFPTLYAVERVGMAGGHTHFGAHDWYETGTAYLLKRQRADGSWHAGSGFVPPLANTCFAMLFLARGRAPVFMNKLEYGEGDVEPASVAEGGAAGGSADGSADLGERSRAGASPSRGGKTAAVAKAGLGPGLGKKPEWSQRPRDVANLAAWVGKTVERELNWQVVGAGAALDDLREAPILYVSGSKVLQPGDDTKAKLREYVETGGLVLGHADCGGRPFANSFRKLGSEMFPRYEFRELPADHPIYKNGIFPREKWKTKPSVLGLSNGVRELMLLIPQADPGRTWQSKVVGGKEELWQLGANVFLYTADRRSLRYRGQSHWVEADEATPARRPVTVARLEHGGNWDPEPGGWRRLANVMRLEQGVGVNVEPVKLGAGELVARDEAGAKVAHLTGTASFKLDEKARAELKAFVDDGGTLVIDAAGGSAAFANAAEAEIKAVWPSGKLEVLPADHPVYAAPAGAGGTVMGAVGYRAFAQKKLVGALKGPRVQGMGVKGGRVGVLFSREDLSAGLVGQPVDGVIGYDPQSATEIMSRLVLHATSTRK